MLFNIDGRGLGGVRNVLALRLYILQLCWITDAGVQLVFSGKG